MKYGFRLMHNTNTEYFGWFNDAPEQEWVLQVHKLDLAYQSRYYKETSKYARL